MPHQRWTDLRKSDGMGKKLQTPRAAEQQVVAQDVEDCFLQR